MKMEIIVALIAAGATVLTIIGSIVAVKVTSNSQIKEQKIIITVRNFLRYLNVFLSSFVFFKLRQWSCTAVIIISYNSNHHNYF